MNFGPDGAVSWGGGGASMLVIVTCLPTGTTAAVSQQTSWKATGSMIDLAQRASHA